MVPCHIRNPSSWMDSDFQNLFCSQEISLEKRCWVHSAADLKKNIGRSSKLSCLFVLLIVDKVNLDVSWMKEKDIQNITWIFPLVFGKQAKRWHFQPNIICSGIGSALQTVLLKYQHLNCGLWSTVPCYTLCPASNDHEAITDLSRFINVFYTCSCFVLPDFSSGITMKLDSLFFRIMESFHLQKTLRIIKSNPALPSPPWIHAPECCIF